MKFKIDNEKLQSALEAVAEKHFLKELREAIAYSPPLIGEIFGEYQRIVEADKPQENGKRLFVVAGTHDEFQYFRRYIATGIRMRDDVKYVYGPEVFRGYRNPDVVFYGTYAQRKDIDDILTMIRVVTL